MYSVSKVISRRSTKISLPKKDKIYFGSILTRDDVVSEHNNYISTLDSIGNKDYYCDQSISVVP